jgi:hypothetical protein
MIGDEAGRGHRLIGLRGERLAFGQMFDGDGYFALVGGDEGLEALGEGLGGGGITQNKQEQGNKMGTMHGNGSAEMGTRI